LYVKLDYADGTVAMDWSKIAHVESPQSFVVADKAGKRYTGTLQRIAEEQPQDEHKVQVAGSSASQTLSGNEVVGISPTDNSFWQNLQGAIDIGFNYTKDESRTQYNFDSDVLYARTKWLVGADYASSFSGGGDVSSLRNDLRLTGQRQLRSPLRPNGC
jgi:hypothetical protein